MVDDRLTRSLKVLATIVLSLLLAVALLWFLRRISTVVMILLGSTFFAYLVFPLVRRFSRRLPRWLAILCVYAIFAAAFLLIVLFIGPRLVFEARALVADFPRLAQVAQSDWLSANIIVNAIPLAFREQALAILQNGWGGIEHSAVTFVGQALSIFLSMAAVVTACVIIPILTFYILMDLERLHAGLLRIVPERNRATFELVLHDIDVVLGGFIRGQIIVAAVIAILVTIMLLLLHIHYAFLIGVFAGVLDIIPYLGALAGAIPAVLIAAFTHGFGSALIVAAGFIVIYQVEGHIIAPNVVGQRVGLTPLIVIVAILIGAELGGIIGMFFAVPVAGCINALATRFLTHGQKQRVA